MQAGVSSALDQRKHAILVSSHIVKSASGHLQCSSFQKLQQMRFVDGTRQLTRASDPRGGGSHQGYTDQTVWAARMGLGVGLVMG